MQIIARKNIKTSHRWLCAIVAVLGCWVSGCDRGPKIVPVSGTLTLDGKPLPFKSVYFYPDRSSGTAGNGAGGYTDGQSKFYLIANMGGATEDQRGACPGKYRVTVTEPAFPITEKSFEKKQDSQAEGDVPAPALGLPAAPAKRVIPPQYATPDTTPLVIEVPPDGGEITLELKTKA